MNNEKSLFFQPHFFHPHVDNNTPHVLHPCWAHQQEGSPNTQHAPRVTWHVCLQKSAAKRSPGLCVCVWLRQGVECQIGEWHHGYQWGVASRYQVQHVFGVFKQRQWSHHVCHQCDITHTEGFVASMLHRAHKEWCNTQSMQGMV